MYTDIFTGMVPVVADPARVPEVCFSPISYMGAVYGWDAWYGYTATERLRRLVELRHAHPEYRNVELQRAIRYYATKVGVTKPPQARALTKDWLRAHTHLIPLLNGIKG